jgi:hypothetical protein
MLRVARRDKEDGNYPKLSTSKKLAMDLLSLFKEEHVDNLSTDWYGGAQLGYKLVRNKWELPDMLQVIFTVWVEFIYTRFWGAPWRTIPLNLHQLIIYIITIKMR